jgi:hypothetical protein
LNGDTLHGYINYGNWETTPKRISFKSNPDASPVKYAAGEISSFKVSVGNPEEYQAYKGPVTTDNPEINHLHIGRDTSFRIDTVFLKIIQTGKNITLFSYADNIKVHYFISSNPGGQPEELIYRIYYNSEEENGRDRSVYDRTYLKQLAAISEKLNDPTLTEAIFKADFAEADLINIAGRINGITDKQLLAKGKSHPSPVKFIVIAALVIALVYSKISFMHSR